MIHQPIKVIKRDSFQLGKPHQHIQECVYYCVRVPESYIRHGTFLFTYAQNVVDWLIEKYPYACVEWEINKK